MASGSQPGSGKLTFTSDEWDAFLAGAKRGEFAIDEAAGTMLATYQRVNGQGQPPASEREDQS
jgi:hypothetical protein